MDPESQGHYRESTFVVDGLSIHFAQWNDRAASTVVLVHGLNAQLHTWDPIAARLARHHRVVALDLRGHGDSDWTKAGYPLAGFVADVAGLYDELGLGRAAVVGHSLGARVALAFAAEYPDRVRRMALSDAGPELSRTGAQRVRANPRNVLERGFRSADEALLRFQEQYPDWDPVFHQLHVQHQLRVNWAGKYVWKSDPELFWLSGSAGARDNDYLWAACERVRCPVLIMRGARSYLFDGDISARMVRAIPDSREIVFDTDHYIPREAPEDFTAALEDFLQEQP